MTKGRIKIKRKGEGKVPDPRVLDNQSPVNPIQFRPVKKQSNKGLISLALFSLVVVLVSAFLLLHDDEPASDLNAESVITPLVTDQIEPRFITQDYYRIDSETSLTAALYQLGLNDPTLDVDENTVARLSHQLNREVKPEEIEGALLTLSMERQRPGYLYISFIPEPSIYEVRIGFGDTAYIQRLDRELIIKSESRSHLVTYDNFYYSLIKDGFSPEFVQDLEETLEYTIDLHHISDQSKAKFRAVYQKAFADEKLVSVDIRAIEFHADGKISRLYQFENGAYYDDKGYSAQRQFLRAPVKFTRVSSPFGLRRHPLSGKVQQHNGIDFAAPEGTPIRALSHGVIEKADFSMGNGYYIKIKHDEIYQTQYLHMLDFAEDVKPGREIRQGEIIGYVGSTGNSTGPHVCLRFWKNGQQIDFFDEKMPHLEQLTGKTYEAFAAIRDSLDRALSKITF